MVLIVVVMEVETEVEVDDVVKTVVLTDVLMVVVVTTWVVVEVTVEVLVRRGKVTPGRLVVLRAVEVFVTVGAVPPMMVVEISVNLLVKVVVVVSGLGSSLVLVKKHAEEGVSSIR